MGLQNKRVMIVEDDAIIALDLEGLLEEAGAIPIGPFFNVMDALQSVDASIDIALLDVNLGSERSDVIALKLRELHIPTFLLSGEQDNRDLGAAFQGLPFIAKPFDPGNLTSMMAAT